MLSEKLSLLYLLKDCGEYPHVYFLNDKEFPVFSFSYAQKNKELSCRKNISDFELMICNFLYEVVKKSYQCIGKSKILHM